MMTPFLAEIVLSYLSRHGQKYNTGETREQPMKIYFCLPYF